MSRSDFSNAPLGSRLRAELQRMYQDLAAQAASGSQLPDDAAWLVDNYSFLQTQIREVRESLPRSYWRRLPAQAGVPRVYPIARELAELAGTDFSAARLQKVLEADPRIAALSMAELWALGPMLKLVLLEAIEPTVARRPITALRAFESVPWRDLVEEVSPVEQILRQDPAGIYARMNFRTRDDCRHAVERIARHSRLDEVQLARLAIEMAREENFTVAHFLIGPGVRNLQSRARYRSSVRERLHGAVLRFPNFFYLGGLAALTASMLLPVRALPWWVLALLILPASQAALTIVNRLVNLWTRRAPYLA